MKVVSSLKSFKKRAGDLYQWKRGKKVGCTSRTNRKFNVRQGK